MFFNAATSDGRGRPALAGRHQRDADASYPLYTPTGPVKDAALTVPCAVAQPAGLACGDYAVNTIQPTYQPYAPGTADARRLPPQTAPTIGDRLSAQGHRLGVVLAAAGRTPNGDVGAPGLDERHHAGNVHRSRDRDRRGVPELPEQAVPVPPPAAQLLRAYAPGTAARAQHLRDEAEFEALAGDSRRHCQLKPVSLVKPIGAENEHPGYASEHTGSDHLVDLLKAVEGSSCAKNTMVIVTYDEFGGQWDHVSPPGQGRRTPGPHDEMGPSTRIPALTIAPGLKHSFSVDHASHDTTSIMATIEHRFGLRPVSSRDARVQDMSTVFGRH